MPNDNEESSTTKPSGLKHCCEQTTAQPMDNDGQEMHAVSSEIGYSKLRQQQHLKPSAINHIRGVGR